MKLICLIFLVGIKSLTSELYSILENILQMTESLAAGLRQNSDPSKIVEVTKIALRHLAIGEGWQ